MMRWALAFLIVAATRGETPVAYRLADQMTVQDRLGSFARDNRVRGERISLLFEKAGCTDLQRQKVRSLPNVICTLAGGGSDRIVVGAHYDKVKTGEGALDNWSGVALLPSLYQSLAGRRRRLTFVFVAFADEEKGLVGSRRYVKGLGKEGIARVKAMVNLDTLGLSPTKVWANRADRVLMALAANVAGTLDLPLSGMNVDGAGDSDSRPFYEKKIPVIDFHSVTQETLPLLHSDRDQMRALRIEEYMQTYRLLAGFLAYLDETLNAGHNAGK